MSGKGCVKVIRVLIVEDDPMVTKINQSYIERIPNYQVCACVQTGEEALRYLEQDKKIDLIILDVFMPKMNGIEMLRKLRSQYTGIDVIFVTAAKEKQIIQSGLQLGAVDYLLKPFTFDRIQSALEKYERRYRLFKLEDEVDQENLDKLFTPSPVRELPKGISQTTLDRIRKAVDASASVLDLKSMKDELHISLVTLRVYLDYLVGCGILIKSTEMGPVGRPTYVYTKVK